MVSDKIYTKFSCCFAILFSSIHIFFFLSNIYPIALSHAGRGLSLLIFYSFTSHISLNFLIFSIPESIPFNSIASAQCSKLFLAPPLFTLFVCVLSYSFFASCSSDSSLVSRFRSLSLDWSINCKEHFSFRSLETSSFFRIKLLLLG